VATGADQPGAQLEGFRHADGLDGDIRAEPVGQLQDAADRVVVADLALRLINAGGPRVRAEAVTRYL